MKKILLLSSVLCIVLTFVGAGYVLSRQGSVNAGYAAVPMLFALISVMFYRKKK